MENMRRKKKTDKEVNPNIIGYKPSAPPESVFNMENKNKFRRIVKRIEKIESKYEI